VFVLTLGIGCIHVTINMGFSLFCYVVYFDNHNFCYRQMIKEIKTDLEQKGLEPSFNMVSKPVICKISPCGGFPDRVTYSAVYSLKSSLNIL